MLPEINSSWVFTTASIFHLRFTR